MRLVPLSQLRFGDGEVMQGARVPKLEAAGVALVATGSIVGLILYANGETKAAAALGAAGILVGAVFSIVRVLDQGASGDPPVIGALLG